MLAKYQEKLQTIQENVTQLANNIIQANQTALDALKKDKHDAFVIVNNILKGTQKLTDNIDNDIVTTFALFKPEARDLRTLIAYLKISSELNQIAVYTKKYAKQIAKHDDEEFELEDMKAYIISLHKSAIKALANATLLISTEDEEKVDRLFTKIKIENSKASDIYSILEKDILTNVCLNPDHAIAYFETLRTLRKLEKTADRAVNIADMLVYAKTGGKIKKH